VVDYLIPSHPLSSPPHHHSGGTERERDRERVKEKERERERERRLWHFGWDAQEIREEK
jgi:hypothetical protein